MYIFSHGIPLHISIGTWNKKSKKENEQLYITTLRLQQKDPLKTFNTTPLKYMRERETVILRKLSIPRGCPYGLLLLSHGRVEELYK